MLTRLRAHTHQGTCSRFFRCSFFTATLVVNDAVDPRCHAFTSTGSSSGVSSGLQGRAGASSGASMSSEFSRTGLRRADVLAASPNVMVCGRRPVTFPVAYFIPAPRNPDEGRPREREYEVVWGSTTEKVRGCVGSTDFPVAARGPARAQSPHSHFFRFVVGFGFANFWTSASKLVRV
jgi:hypothetical protein